MTLLLSISKITYFLGDVGLQCYARLSASQGSTFQEQQFSQSNSYIRRSRSHRLKITSYTLQLCEIREKVFFFHHILNLLGSNKRFKCKMSYEHNTMYRKDGRFLLVV